MDYKKEMKRLEKAREKYFPVIGALLDMTTHDGGRPLAIDDPDIMRTVLELIDIGYLDPDAFIINKRFGEIRGLYFRGGAVLTGAGLAEYERDHERRRKVMLRRLIVAVSVVLLSAAVMAVVSLLNF